MSISLLLATLLFFLFRFLLLIAAILGAGDMAPLTGTNTNFKARAAIVTRATLIRLVHWLTRCLALLHLKGNGVANKTSVLRDMPPVLKDRRWKLSGGLAARIGDITGGPFYLLFLCSQGRVTDDQRYRDRQEEEHAKNHHVIPPP